MSLTWAQALAWRMQRQLLDPVGRESVAGVVRRLGALPAQSDSAVELAIRTRRVRSKAGEVDRALAEGRIIKTFAFRGATHLMTPEDAGVYLALRSAGRMWELASWQTHYGLAPEDWPPLREAVRDALAGGPLAWDEVGEAVTSRRRFRHLGFAFATVGTFAKPFAWQGDLSFAPAKEGKATFQLLETNPRWAGLPHLDEAGPRAVEAYLGTYGPATSAQVHYWLGGGLSAGRKRIDGALAGSGDRLTTVDIEGEPAYVLRHDVDALRATRASTTVRLLPGHDQWVLGAGTSDAHVVPPARRTPVTRGANLVIAGGVVSGTWSLENDHVAVTWFTEAGKPPEGALQVEAQRLATILGRSLPSVVTVEV